MKKRKHEKNFIRNRSGGMKQKLPGRLLSLMCALILVFSTVFLDLGHISAYAFGDELYLETEAEETAEAGAEAQAADLGDDESQINTELSEDISEDPAEVSAEEAEDASEADFSSGDNLDEQELTTEEPEISDDSAAETITYTQLINNDTVEVRAEAPAGALPEGAQLVVKQVRNNTEDVGETEKYNTLNTRLTELLQTKAQNLEGFLPYNISFIDSEGNPAEPAAKVSYSFQYKEAAAPELTDPTKVTVSAAELKKNKETSEYELTELKAEEDKATLETNENKQLQRAGFQSADTAVFAFVWSSTTETTDNTGNEGTQAVTPVGTIEITADEVNLRQAPSTEAEILAVTTAGTQFPLLETVTAEDESTWYKVSYTADTAAYVRSDMAIVLDENQEEEVPAEEAPAEITRYDYQSDEVNVKVTLTDPADLPDNAELSVTPVELSQEAEEQIAEEAIKEKKAIENIRSYDIKFLVDGEEVQPGATVKVEVSFPDEETAQDAAVYHVDQDEKVENMDGSINKEGNVEFETTHFSTYVIVNTKQGDITVTVEHYNADTEEKIYADDASKTLHVGQKLNPKKATNWEISKVVVSTGNGSDSTYSNVDEIQLAQDATVKIYYKPSTGTFAGAPTFFDYTVKAGESGGKSYSINMEDNYTDKDSNRFAMGGGDNYSSYTKEKYNWYQNGYSVNGWTSPNGATITGLMDGLNNDGSVRFKDCADPGLFTDSDVKVTVDNHERYLRRVYRNYTLDFTRTGDTYQLSGIKDGNGSSVTGNYNGTTGYNFFPLDNVSVNYESARTNVVSGETSDTNVVAGNHNYYFGMRYDIEFSVGNYVGPLNYTFKGDDDMWVILDGKDVVIDLGGIHNAVEGSVNLWNYLTEGDTTTHTLTVLYLERGAGASNCYMNFTLPNATISQVTSDPLGTLSFEKVNKDSEPLEGATFGLYTDQECTTLVATASSNAEGNVTFNKLREGTYYLKEIQAPDGYVTSGNVWTVEAKKTSDTEVTEVTVTLKDSNGNAVKNNQIINQVVQQIIEGHLDYGKTAHVKNWDDRTYNIDITASSKYTSSSTTERNSVADIMMVFDTSGSMLYEQSGEHNDSKGFVLKGVFNKVKATLDASRVYYYGNGTTKVNYSSGWDSWNYTNAKSPMIYLNNNWIYFDGSSWQSVPSDSTTKIYTVDSSLTGLKEASTAFITSTAGVSAGSRIGLATFNSVSNLVSGLTEVGTSKDNLIKAVNSVRASAGTSPQKGLELAKTQLSGTKRQNVPQYVILFTDGEPSGSNDKTSSEARAKELREAGITVFTVGLNLNTNTETWLRDKIASENCAFEADSVDSLKIIFKRIQETITHNIDVTGAEITDVIDPRFEILKTDGSKLEAEDFDENGEYRLGEDGVVTILPNGNYQIKWTNQTIPSSGQWKKTITVKAKDNYIGGNNVTTNAPGSMIDTGYEQVDLPFPAVNVKVNMEVANKTVTIYKGDQTPTEAEILNQLFDKTNTTTSYDDVKVDATKVTVKWYRDKGCTDEIKNPDMEHLVDHPAATTEYYIKVTYDAGKPTTESNGNTDGNFAGTETGDTYIASATNVDDRDKETKRTYGVYKVEVKSGEIGITKNLVDQDNKPVISAENQEFTFKVTKKSKDGNVDEKFTPVEVKITVPAGQTTANLTDVTKLTNLSRGIYEVEEIKVPKEYKTAGADVIVKNNQTAGTDCKYSTADDNSYKVTFKLGYKMDNSATDTDVIKVGNDANGKKCYTYDGKDGGVKGLVAYNNTLVTTDLDLKKVDKDGRNNLTGARFKLEKWEVAEGENEDSWKSVSDAYDSITVDNGRDARELLNLLAGRYRLTEIEAPRGYSLLGASIYFKVEDGKVTLTDENGTNKEATQTMWTLDEGKLVLTIKNAELYSLPSSGGPGIYGFTISGVAFITAALLLFINNKRKEDKENVRRMTE